MNVSCKKFWKRLIGKDITKAELRFAICRELSCGVGDARDVVLDYADRGGGNRNAKWSCGSSTGQCGRKLAR